MSKKLTVQLNGEPMTLNVGVGRFYHLYKEGTGRDLLSFKDGVDTSQIIEVACGIVYAGYNAECKLNKEPAKYTKEQLWDLVMDADAESAAKIVTDYLKTVSAGEPESQPII